MLMPFWKAPLNNTCSWCCSCVCPQMESQGLYKAMGELNLLFNFFETFLASKRNRGTLAWGSRPPDLGGNLKEWPNLFASWQWGNWPHEDWCCQCCYFFLSMFFVLRTKFADHIVSNYNLLVFAIYLLLLLKKKLYFFYLCHFIYTS